MTTDSYCWLCRRVILLGNEDWRIVTGPHGNPVVICGRCVEHGDGEVEVSYEEPDLNREGDPAFNGAW